MQDNCIPPEWLWVFCVLQLVNIFRSGAGGVAVGVAHGARLAKPLALQLAPKTVLHLCDACLVCGAEAAEVWQLLARGRRCRRRRDGGLLRWSHPPRLACQVAADVGLDGGRGAVAGRLL